VNYRRFVVRTVSQWDVRRKRIKDILEGEPAPYSLLKYLRDYFEPEELASAQYLERKTVEFMQLRRQLKTDVEVEVGPIDSDTWYVAEMSGVVLNAVIPRIQGSIATTKEARDDLDELISVCKGVRRKLAQSSVSVVKMLRHLQYRRISLPTKDCGQTCFSQVVKWQLRTR
jgi:hypothetical protein